MPYKRNYRRRAPIRRRPRGTVAKRMVEGHNSTMIEKMAWGAGAVSTLARAIVPYIKANNAEAKYFDQSATVNPTFPNASIVVMSNMAQGLTDITRIGNSIKAKDLKVKYTFTPSYTSLPYNNTRVMIIIDKMQGGVAAPVITQILEDSTNYLSPLNKDFTDRFVLLRDNYYTINQGGNAPLQHELFLKLDYHIRYLSSGAAVADQGPGAIYFVVINREATNVNTTSFYSRLNYYDN